MYFCSGPPRTYALGPEGERERFEHVALALHPWAAVVARVSSTSVTLWAAHAHTQQTTQRPRQLAVFARGGRYVEHLTKKRAEEKESESQGGEEDAAAKLWIEDSVGGQLPHLWTLWVSHEVLVVVEKGSQVVEFYRVEGLVPAAAGQPESSAVDPLAPEAPASPTSAVPITGRFTEDYPLNQGDSPRDRKDVACSMNGIPGSPYVFVGMSSGLVCVVEVPELSQPKPKSWFGSDEPVTPSIWKIDVLPHLQHEDEAKPAVPSCYGLTCASLGSQSSAKLYLVASFEGGKCFIMLISPIVKCIDQLLSLVNTERDSSTTCFGRCTSASLDSSGTRLALGWSDGGVSLFLLSMKRPASSTPAPPAPVPPALVLEPIRELSLSPWGYMTNDIGAVTSLAWSADSLCIAVGYELRGFSLFSTDGCRLMSSLPQHHQPRPVGGTAGDQVTKEICSFGVLALTWTTGSSSLMVVSRGELAGVVVPVDPAEALSEIEDDANVGLVASELYEQIEVDLLKEQDGLCLSLSGAPSRCGAWVRSENSFIRRASNGGVGPAEASGMIRGGDLLIGINEGMNVINLPFEQIVGKIKELPNNTVVRLVFLRLQWERVFPLAAQGLTSTNFMETHGIQLLGDEDLCIREYALRMQVLHGDCDLEARPSMLEFEKRAKFDGWEALQGVSVESARHRYIKLLFALFPIWNPHHFLHVLVEYSEGVAAQERYHAREQVERNRPQMIINMRKRSVVAFAEFEFAKSVPLAGGSASHLILLEHSTLRLLATPSLDDPSALTSCVSWKVPSEFEAHCCPLRLLATSPNNKHIAVAGQRGFCLLNKVTGKWRMFGNVNEERDMRVYSLLWAQDDIVVVQFTRFSENHEVSHLHAYPRNHLDDESILARMTLLHDEEETADSLPPSLIKPSDGNVGDLNPDCFLVMGMDEEVTHLFGVSRRELWCFSVDTSGSTKQSDLEMQLELRRKVKLPINIVESIAAGNRDSQGIIDFTVLPRFLHVQDEHLKQQQQEKYQAERELEHQENRGGGWLSAIVNMLAGGEVPDQYQPEDVLPRFAFLDNVGDIVVWDPEIRSQRVLCSNVTTMSRLFVSPSECPAWPTSCRLMYGLYGPEGMKVWLPLLDGVYLTHCKAFEEDDFRLETFLACHDPLRAKTYEIEFGTAPPTAELYEHVLREYGIVLEHFQGSMMASRKQLDEGVTNLRGCITSVDDTAAKDRMLRFDSDVKVLGIEQNFGLLVGISQDVYVPSGMFLPCYDLFSRVQPFFHTLMCFLVQNHQLEWARQVLDSVRTHYALSTPTQELFLHSMLEACFSSQCSEATFQSAIELLQPASLRGHGGPESEKSPSAEGSKLPVRGDVDEYCEIVAHVARKSEPSRLKVLFPLAGDPLEFLAICSQRSELRTAANFLLILEESTSLSPMHGLQDSANGRSKTFRSECAANLVEQCVEQEEWSLAQHVVRVARDWEHPTAEPNGHSTVNNGSDSPSARRIDEQLGQVMWKDLNRGEYGRVVRCLNDLQAHLPRNIVHDPRYVEDEENHGQKLFEYFIQGHQRKELR